MRMILILGLVFNTSLGATEIDSFTLRDPQMRDSLEELDGIIQSYFDKALKQANQAHSCNASFFEKILYNLFKGFFWTQFEVDIETSNTLDRRNIERSNSIYRDLNFFETMALFMADLGYVMKIGNFYVGSDKLGHFLETGYDYYRSHSLQEALGFGELTERTYFGFNTTGVYSYGDLAANLDGYEFWTRVTGGKQPYFSCKNNTWKQSRPFSWSDYVNAAWDEGLNCNYFADDHITAAVSKRIEDLGMKCPVEPGHCPSMLQRYGVLAAHVVMPSCF